MTTRLALVVLLSLAGCGSDYLVGENESTLKPCGGIAGLPCAAGQTCVDIPNDDCDPAKGGADCGGMCQPNAPKQCAADTDCPKVGAPCTVCADGSSACPKSWCDAGTCRVTFATCAPPPNPQCTVDTDCAVPAGPCKQCSDPNTFVCPTGGCFNGVCKTWTPDCPPPAPQCKVDGDCVQPLAPCKLCADGSFACPKATCTNGQCKAEFPTCPIKSCGGFAGFPCPAGYQCVDVPNDGCDPKAGGADCPGMCI